MCGVFMSIMVFGRITWYEIFVWILHGQSLLQAIIAIITIGLIEYHEKNQSYHLGITEFPIA